MHVWFRLVEGMHPPTPPLNPLLAWCIFKQSVCRSKFYLEKKTGASINAHFFFGVNFSFDQILRPIVLKTFLDLYYSFQACKYDLKRKISAGAALFGRTYMRKDSEAISPKKLS